MKGFESALSCGMSEVAVFTGASEGFVKKNINCSIAESFNRFTPIFKAAEAAGVKVRGYVSCVIACPYDGPTEPQAVTDIADKLLNLGCYEVSLGDTIGVGTPGTFTALLDNIEKSIPVEKLAVHCHDTYGQALVNIYTALEYGITVVDSSIAGLGGCPYARGATGNVSTEDLVYMLNGLNVQTGVDLDKLIRIGDWICEALGKTNNSRTAAALRQKGNQSA